MSNVEKTNVREVQRETLKAVPNCVPFSVIVPYYSNVQAFTACLINLQSQLVPPKRIIVIDTSPNKQGLDIARRWNTGTSEIVVECAYPCHIQEAWNKGIELAGTDDVLIINDDILMPSNALDVIALVNEAVNCLCIVPTTPARDHTGDFVTKEFKWFAEVPTSKNQLTAVGWMPGFCYYLTRDLINKIGNFDEGFKVWFGDDDYQARIHAQAVKDGIPAIVQIDTLYFHHFGGKSYKYQSKEVQDLIELDRQYFAKKYEVDIGDVVDLAKEPESKPIKQAPARKKPAKKKFTKKKK